MIYVNHFRIAENIRSKLENEEVQKTVASVIDGYKNILKLKRGFRIGDDRQVKQYDNQYSINDYAKRPHLRAKERDKKKYMCGRFSLADEHAFEVSLYFFFILIHFEVVMLHFISVNFSLLLWI